MSGISRKLGMLAVVALAAAMGASGAAWAQRTYYDLPPGPYRGECRNERVEGGYLLRATCPKRNGEMREASLDLRTCPRGSSVVNDGAYLRCGSGGFVGGGTNTEYGSSGYGLPPGPYRAECRNERVEGGYLLRATCPKHNGEMRESSLDLRTCPRGTPVFNDGAYLKCGGGSGGQQTGWGSDWRGGYSLPPGPYRSECRRERIVNGYLLMATCPKRNGEMRDASLDLRTCPPGAAVYNDGAYLRCQ